jgi:hypothetical protein
MIVLEKSADGYSLRDADFELSFNHVGDRWHHRVSIRIHGEWIPLLTSAEGAPTDDVPPSPPLQDLRFEKLADTIFEFQLLGQSGKGVYSAAVRFDGGAGTIDFDLCARGRSKDSPLCTASRYFLPGDNLLPHIRQLGDSIVLIPLGGRSVDMTPVPIADSPHSECRLTTLQHVRRIDAGCFGIMGSDLPGKAFSIRWRYRMTLAGQA